MLRKLRHDSFVCIFEEIQLEDVFKHLQLHANRYILQVNTALFGVYEEDNEIRRDSRGGRGELLENARQNHRMKSLRAEELLLFLLKVFILFLGDSENFLLMR